MLSQHRRTAIHSHGILKIAGRDSRLISTFFVCCTVLDIYTRPPLDLSNRKHSYSPTMEEDRAIADLGPEIPVDLDGEDETAKKTPKRRFIGRRAADAKAAAKGETQNNGGTIEDSGAVQGANYSYTARQYNEQPSSCLAQSLPAAALPVP
jgi:hypothetical protein